MITLRSERCLPQATVGGSKSSRCRRAGYLGESDQAMLLLHDRPAEGGCMHWIICPPVGVDYMNAWRGLRHLAETLVAAGHEAWRIDYPQTGSSADGGGADQVNAWVEGILRLVDQLRQQSPDCGVGLIGFRFGATLAALASAERSVGALVCWSPVVKGSQFMRQTRLLQQTSEQQPSGDLLEAAGWVLNAETQAAVSAIDLLKLQPQADRILVIDGDAATRSRKLAKTWQDKAPLEYAPIDEAPGMLVDAHLTELPRKTLEHVRDWLQDFSREKGGECNRSGILPSSVQLQVHPEGDDRPFEVIESAGFVNSRFFAVYCHPPRSASPDTPLVLLLNSGSNHQVGPNRIYVTLARLLAESGIESLRVDLPGLGETPAAAGAEENLPYPPDPSAAMQQIVDAPDLRGRPLILMGLCSGAYHAFLGAIELQADIREVILINPLTFYWEQGMQLEDAPSVSYGEWSWYQKSVRDPDRWKRLLTGRINPWPIALSMMRRLQLKLKTRLRRFMDRFEPKQPNRITPSLGNSLRKIEDRGVRLSLVFSDTDPGLAIIREQAGGRLKAMLRRGSAEMLLIKRADHTLSRRHARMQLIDWLRRHFGK